MLYEPKHFDWDGFETGIRNDCAGGVPDEEIEILVSEIRADPAVTSAIKKYDVDVEEAHSVLLRKLNAVWTRVVVKFGRSDLVEDVESGKFDA